MSHTSRDGLLGSPSPTAQKTNNRLPPLPQSTSYYDSATLPQPAPAFRQRDDDELSFRRSQPPVRNSDIVHDEDALVLADSVVSSRRNQNGNPPPSGNKWTDDDDDGDEEDALFTTKSPIRTGAAPNATPRAAKAVPAVGRNTSMVDPSIAASARLASQWEQKPVARTAGQRVMTPAQFEHYKRQQEISRENGAATLDNRSDDGDNYEDDEEQERDKKAAQLRKKQEASLAIYRQKMMKVTGEQPPKGPSPSIGGSGPKLTSLSAPDLTNRVSNLTVESNVSGASGKSSGTEEEDEDVPLGILAAHGFPNKNRPPGRLAGSGSNSDLRSLSQAQSIAENGRNDSRGSLPVFARKLPQDPYYGAGLVNPSNRESFHMSGGASTPQGQTPVVAPPNAHPQGLVGVIAGEERARALRRASPGATAQGGFDMPNMHPGMNRSMTTGNLPGMFPGGMPPGALSPSDQAQLQMSQQMTQMMQMQMQWMQHMMGMQPGQAMPQMPPMGSPLAPGQMMPQPGMMPSDYFSSAAQATRPMSMPMPTSPQLPQARTMSTLSPSMANWNPIPSIATPSMYNGFAPNPPAHQQQYAHSIAPSERSNIGLASRYRPVSTIISDVRPTTHRASTFSSGSFSRFVNQNGNGRLSPGNITVKADSNLGKKTPNMAVVDDDDDENGWAEMKKKRDKKKSLWKMKTADKDNISDLYTGSEI